MGSSGDEVKGTRVLAGALSQLIERGFARNRGAVRAIDALALELERSDRRLVEELTQLYIRSDAPMEKAVSTLMANGAWYGARPARGSLQQFASAADTAATAAQTRLVDSAFDAVVDASDDMARDLSKTGVARWSVYEVLTALAWSKTSEQPVLMERTFDQFLTNYRWMQASAEASTRSHWAALDELTQRIRNASRTVNELLAGAPVSARTSEADIVAGLATSALLGERLGLSVADGKATGWLLLRATGQADAPFVPAGIDDVVAQVTRADAVFTRILGDGFQGQVLAGSKFVQDRALRAQRTRAIVEKLAGRADLKEPEALSRYLGENWDRLWAGTALMQLRP